MKMAIFGVMDMYFIQVTTMQVWIQIYWSFVSFLFIISTPHGVSCS